MERFVGRIKGPKRAGGGIFRQPALHLCKNLVFHERTKHVDFRYHFIRAKATEGSIHVDKVAMEENPADLKTMVLTLNKFIIILNFFELESVDFDDSF